MARDRSRGAAFEMKFLLEPARADAVAAWAQVHLRPDPHGDPAREHGYDVTTTYLDTSELDIARRTPGAGSRKFRLRRYGTEDVVWLERKIRRQERVRKVRVAVSTAELGLLASEVAPLGWVGAEFRFRVQDRELVPAGCIGYRRTAWFADTAEGPIRVTLDRRIRGLRHREWSVPELTEDLPWLTPALVCEMKFRAAMPSLLKVLVADLGLVPASFSKYRCLMQGVGGVPSDAGGDHEG